MPLPKVDCISCFSKTACPTQFACIVYKASQTKEDEVTAEQVSSLKRWRDFCCRLCSAWTPSQVAEYTTGGPPSTHGTCSLCSVAPPTPRPPAWSCIDATRPTGREGRSNDSHFCVWCHCGRFGILGSSPLSEVLLHWKQLLSAVACC